MVTTQKPTTAAVVGCGDISSEHFAAIAANPDVVVVEVSDTDPGRREIAAAATSCRGYSDYRQLVAGQRPDVVHICTPHHPSRRTPVADTAFAWVRAAPPFEGPTPPMWHSA